MNIKLIMLDYFWKQQDDIPAGMGYPLFGTAHLLSVFITLILVVFLILAIHKLEEKKQKNFLKMLPVLMLGMEVFKDAFLVSVHRFGIGYLPLHICSIGIFVFLLREWLPWALAKDVFGEIAFIIIMPASIAALLFADWTVYYPVLNFMNIYSYIWHGLLVLYPILLKLRGDIQPSIRHIHYCLLFLLVVVPPIYVFDKHFGCNYFFVNWPIPGTPLSWMASFMGNPGYLLGYAGLTLAVILLMYFLIHKNRIYNTT
ncbi:YwaF family protein [Butyrivibrio sp. AE2032]|uniref:YwaF family protein n=1 Tax=Butyrivibrio sp. AE2032 TaxID=1458463 RepID=UPI000554E289|nr:YwaF family protein [Butyrivibrio sp. AE2032]